jgi:hypothetical protein
MPRAILERPAATPKGCKNPLTCTPQYPVGRGVKTAHPLPGGPGAPGARAYPGGGTGWFLVAWATGASGAPMRALLSGSSARRFLRMSSWPIPSGQPCRRRTRPGRGRSRPTRPDLHPALQRLRDEMPVVGVLPAASQHGFLVRVVLTDPLQAYGMGDVRRSVIGSADRYRPHVGFRASITAVTAITSICPYPPPFFALHRATERARACSDRRREGTPKSGDSGDNGDGLLPHRAQCRFCLCADTEGVGP